MRFIEDAKQEYMSNTITEKNNTIKNIIDEVKEIEADRNERRKDRVKDRLEDEMQLRKEKLLDNLYTH